MGSILSLGRRVFPVADYGYGSFLKDSQSRISFARWNEQKTLAITFPGQRHLTQEGRYVPGYDCFESSFWIYDSLLKWGYVPTFVQISNPFFAHDYAVECEGNLLTLTPGINVNLLNTIIQEFPDNQAQKDWMSHTSPVIPLDVLGQIILSVQIHGQKTFAHWLQISFEKGRSLQDWYHIRYSTSLIHKNNTTLEMTLRLIAGSNQFDKIMGSFLKRGIFGTSEKFRGNVEFKPQLRVPPSLSLDARSLSKVSQAQICTIFPFVFKKLGVLGGM